MTISVGEFIYLFEAQGRNPTTLQIQTFVFASGRGYNDPSSPYGPYLPVLEQPANIERHAFQAGQTYGTSQAPFSFGAVQVINESPDLLTAGTYDFLLDYGFDGLTGRLLLIDPTQNYSTAKVILTGTLEQVVDDGAGIMSFNFRDATLALDQPFQTNVFAGTNSGATGVEGTSNDIKGKPKPYAFGAVSNASPEPANAVALVYQESYRQISAIGAVYDKGAALTVGTAQASLAALLAGTPLASHYDYYLGSATDGAYFKLGSNPAGAITSDLSGDATGAVYVSTTADIWKRVLLMALPNATVSASDITALNAAQPAVIGIYIDGDATFRQVLDQLASGAGCYYGLDSSGTWRISQLMDPASGTAVCNVTPFVSGSVQTVATDCDIVEIKRDKPNDPQSSDPNNGVPAWYINLNWGKNFTVQAAGELAGNSAARAAFTSLEFRSAVAQDSGTSTTALTVATGAQTITVAEAQANWSTGQLVSVHTADNTKIMVGTVTSFATPTLVLNIIGITGSGSSSAWVIDGTKALHSLARILTFDTLFTVVADAFAEAKRLLTMYRVRRDFITVKVQLQSATTVSLIDLGSIVNLKFGRWGYAAGKKMLVIGIIYDAEGNIMTLNLWG